MKKVIVTFKMPKRWPDGDVFSDSCIRDAAEQINSRHREGNPILISRGFDHSLPPIGKVIAARIEEGDDEAELWLDMEVPELTADILKVVREQGLDYHAAPEGKLIEVLLEGEADFDSEKGEITNRNTPHRVIKKFAPTAFSIEASNPAQPLKGEVKP